MEFFRQCPQCGRRFHIKLVDKKLEQVLDKEEMWAPPRFATTRGMALLVEEGELVTVDTDEFQYLYKCKHCGHEWSEEHIEKHVERPGTRED